MEQDFAHIYCYDFRNRIDTFKNKIKFIENLNKEDIKFKSPYEIVDNIKKLK